MKHLFQVHWSQGGFGVYARVFYLKPRAHFPACVTFCLCPSYTRGFRQESSYKLKSVRPRDIEREVKLSFFVKVRSHVAFPLLPRHPHANSTVHNHPLVFLSVRSCEWAHMLAVLFSNCIQNWLSKYNEYENIWFPSATVLV